MIRNDQGVQPELKITEVSKDCRTIQNKIPLKTYPNNLCEWLHLNAQIDPEKPFLMERNGSDGWNKVTWKQTLSLVNRISNNLLKIIKDTTKPVALLSENCTKMALVQLAAMQVGIPVVPISLAYSVRSKTGSLVKHILDVSDAKILIMSNADLHMAKINQWETKDLLLYSFSGSDSYKNVNSYDELTVGEDELSISAKKKFDNVTPETIAKIQFTSGSTNLPKGVIVTHKMMMSNQIGISQMWPFLKKEDVLLDWLPWNHTFGGNFVFNIALMHGNTFYIDNGNPTPEGLTNTIKNIKNVSPSIYFNVPRGYTALLAAMEQDEELRTAFFKNLKFIFNAAAALDQSTFDGLKKMSANTRGEALPFFTGWGATETSPDSTLVYWDENEAKVIGCPIPGVEIKLIKDTSGKLEMRVKGPNVTPGYYKNVEASQKAFDDDGYYRTGDAGKLQDPNNPSIGLVFDGRIGEDFKLDTGVWVNNANIRASINELGQPYQLEVVLAAPNKAYLAVMVFPNIPLLRKHFETVSNSYPEDNIFLGTPEVINFFRDVFQKHNAKGFGSSGTIKKFCILTVLPRMDKNEITDKGYINQSAVLNNRADIVDSLFSNKAAKNIYSIERK